MKSIGQLGEDLAADFLKKLKYKIIDRNFRIRGGEIDIIASTVKLSSTSKSKLARRTSLACRKNPSLLTKSIF